MKLQARDEGTLTAEDRSADNPSMPGAMTPPLGLSYATPASTRQLGSTISVVAGLALAFLGAAVLLLGMISLAEYGNQLDRDTKTGFTIAISIFSGICLLSAVPLIYRGTRGPIQ